MNTSETVSPIERTVRAESEWARLQKALRESEQRYHALFNSIDEGFCVIEMLFDANGRPNDYRFIEINRLFEEQTGLVHPLGRTARELVPDLEERWFELYGQVALTGKPARFIEGSDKMGRWFEVHAFRVVDGAAPQVAIRFRDITARRGAEAALYESRQRLQTAMDAARMYSWEMDLTTRHVDWSSNHKDVLGFALPENFEDAVQLLHPDDREPTTRAVLRAIESREPYLGEFRIINPNNDEVVWGTWQGVVAGEAADGQRSFVGITQNVTARKHAEEALLASNARLQMLVSQSAAGIVEADLEGRFTFVNRRFCQITGYTESEVLQLRVHDLTHPEDRAKSAELFNQLAAGGADYDLEKRYLRKDGSAVWVSNSVSGMRAEGRVRSLMAVSIDVTARRAAERGQLEADARKDEFLAILAHELRSPLAPIRNSAQIMQLVEPREPRLQSAIDVIERQTRHLTRLVDDLLDVSRINLGKIDLRMERIDVGSVVQSALETSRPMIDLARHELIISVPEDPVFVRADAVRLAQVFSNLLNNAAKYTEQGGRVELVARRDSGQVAISIRDSGVGIAPDMLPHVFQMFVQVDRSLERSRSGLGIGLALAQRIVEMHGGSLTAHSSGVAGKGSEFVVRLPISIEAPVTSERDDSESDQGPAGSRHAQRRRRILVADDNQDSVESLGLLLSIDGNEVLTVLDGRAAVEAVPGFAPDLVVLDIGMPKMNGYDAAREIRKHSLGKDVVLIALTGWGQEDVKRQCEEAGFNGHLVKPADYAALKRLIADLPTAHTR